MLWNEGYVCFNKVLTSSDIMSLSFQNWGSFSSVFGSIYEIIVAAVLTKRLKHG